MWILSFGLWTFQSSVLNPVEHEGLEQRVLSKQVSVFIRWVAKSSFPPQFYSGI